MSVRGFSRNRPGNDNNNNRIPESLSKVLKTRNTQRRKERKTLEECALSAIETAVVFEQLEDEEKKNEMQKLLEQYLGLVQKMDVNTKVLKKINKGDYGDQEPTEFMADQVEEFEAKSVPESFKQHKWWKKMLEDVWEVHHEDEPMPGQEDEEVVISKKPRTLKCPLTQKLMKKPVRNTVCGHAYEGEAIKDYVRRRGTRRTKVECPVVGCASDVTLDHLERAVELERLLAKRSKRKRKETVPTLDIE